MHDRIVLTTTQSIFERLIILTQPGIILNPKFCWLYRHACWLNPAAVGKYHREHVPEGQVFVSRWRHGWLRCWLSPDIGDKNKSKGNIVLFYLVAPIYRYLILHSDLEPMDMFEHVWTNNLRNTDWWGWIRNWLLGSKNDQNWWGLRLDPNQTGMRLIRWRLRI